MASPDGSLEPEPAARATLEPAARATLEPAARATLGWGAVAIALFVGAALLRVHNAYGLFIDHGFDESFNWEYIQYLTRTWALPDPESLWSAARPPFFFYAGGALARAFGPAQQSSVHAIRLVSSAFGLFAIAVALGQLWRGSRADPLRVALACGLLLFVPAHIYLSAMLNEEVAVASWTTLALVLALWEQRVGGDGWASWGRVIGIGILGGFAFLTKLTGCLVVIAVAASFVLDGWRRGELKPALARAASLSLIALVVGGWFYARSYMLHGYLYPQSLEAHSIMLSMPPGERSWLDYLRFSFAAFTDTRVDSPGLLHSVWGGTYVTWWFDGHRHFVPRVDPTVDRMGLAILLLALLPTAASLVGAVRGIGRSRHSARAVDTPMLALVAITLAGYAFYTWNNPWFACIKASYLLGLGLPYAWWASEQLARWCRSSRWLGTLVALDLCLLLGAIVAAFTFGTPLWEMTLGVHLPGLPWLPDQR